MVDRDVEYLIIGAGLAGTVLHHFLRSDDVVVLDPAPGRYKVGESIIPELFHHPEINALVDEARTLPSWSPKTGVTFMSRDAVASFPLPTHGSQVSMHIARTDLEALMHRRWGTPIVREGVVSVDVDSRTVTTERTRYRVRRQILDCSGPAMVVARAVDDVTSLWPIHARWAYLDIAGIEEARFWGYVRGNGLAYRRFDVPNGQLLDQSEDPHWRPSHTTLIRQVSDTVWTWQIPLYRETILSFGVVSRSDRIGTPELYALADRFGAPHFALRRRPRGKGPLDRVHARRHYARRAGTASTDAYVLVGDAACFGDPLYSVGTGLAANKAIELAAILNGPGWSATASTAWNRDYATLMTRAFAAFETWYRGELLHDSDTAREVRQNYLVGSAFQVGIATQYARVLIDAGPPAAEAGPGGRGRHLVDPRAAPLTDAVISLLGDPRLAQWTLAAAYRTPHEVQLRWRHPDKPELVVHLSVSPDVTRYYRRIGDVTLSFMNLWERPYPLGDRGIALFDALEAHVAAHVDDWTALWATTSSAPPAPPPRT